MNSTHVKSGNMNVWIDFINQETSGTEISWNVINKRSLQYQTIFGVYCIYSCSILASSMFSLEDSSNNINNIMLIINLIDF